MSMLLLFFCWQHANQWKCWSKLWFPCRDLSICWIVHQKHNMNQIWHLCLLQCLDDIYVCMTVAQNVVEKWARPAWQLKNVSNSMGLAIAQVPLFYIFAVFGNAPLNVWVDFDKMKHCETIHCQFASKNGTLYTLKSHKIDELFKNSYCYWRVGVELELIPQTASTR